MVSSFGEAPDYGTVPIAKRGAASLISEICETSGRSIYLRLDKFDQLYLHCEPCPAISYINFYVSLAHPDSK